MNTQNIASAMMQVEGCNKAVCEVKLNEAVGV